jgi:hypothetical protein
MKCLYPNCSKEEATRGLCKSHYAYASFLVRKGKIESLENFRRFWKM